MNFEEDLREQITKLLKEDKIKFNEKDTTCGLLISYLNVVNRRIDFVQRKVFISDNIEKIINNNKLNKEYINALLKFKFNFEKGMDMNGHLSANIYHSDLSVKNKEKWTYKASRDYLLDDWGIYHLHLNEKEAKNEKEMRNNRHNKEKGNRSKYLLFVKITDKEVYFIDILNHNENNVFAKQELLETIDRNWHHLLVDYVLPEITSIPKMTDREIQKRRENNEFILYEVNGKVYSTMGGGLTSAGTNILHTTYADNILDEIEKIEEDIKNRYKEIKHQIQKKMKNYYKDLKFKFQLAKNGYVITEINTNFKICYHIEGDNLVIYYDGFFIKY